MPGVLERGEAAREKSGRYFNVLNCASDYGLSVEVYGLEWVFVTPRSTSRNATGFEVMELPRSALPAVDEIRLFNGRLDQDAIKAQLEMPFDERPIRELLLSVIWVFHHGRLLHCAERCLLRQRNETMLTSRDLLQGTTSLMLAGDLEWHCSLELLVRSTLTTIFNLSPDHTKFEKKMRRLEENDDRLPAVMTDADRIAVLTLLNGDLERELAALPRAQREVMIDRYVLGMKPQEIAEKRGRAVKTVKKTKVRRRKRRLEGARSWRHTHQIKLSVKEQASDEQVGMDLRMADVPRQIESATLRTSDT